MFQRLKEEFRERRISFKTETYKDFEKVDINNAVLLAYRRYIHRLDKFQALHEELGRDMRRVVEYFKALRASGDQIILKSFLE